MYRVSLPLLTSLLTVCLLMSACADSGSTEPGDVSGDVSSDMSGDTSTDLPSDGVSSECGNGIIESGEECEGEDFGGATCETEGFFFGDLSCGATCQLDTSACSSTPAECGNGVVEADEACDGTDFGGETCASQGYTGGELSCDVSCNVNLDACYTCGNNMVEPGEACDDGNTVDDFTCAANCQSTCRPGFGECEGNVSTYCASDGETVLTETCDNLQGLTCDAGSGRCSGPCSAGSLGTSYIGCDYYPTVTPNMVGTQFNFAVAVSNTTVNTATVTITRGANTVSTVDVAPDSVQIVNLPWVNELRGPADLFVVPFPSSVSLADGAYRLRSTQPVTVYQFNPIEFTSGNPDDCINNNSLCSFTNDASILLPSHVWGSSYRVSSYPHFEGTTSGFYAVTAHQDNTTVNLSPGVAAVSVKGGVPGLDSSGSGQVTMNEGDVMLAVSASGDVTGALVESDKPVQVIGGHQCTYIPPGVAACDHLEESMFPLSALSTDYLVTAPLVPTVADTPKVEIVRIMATEANTSLTFEPAQPGAPGSIAQAGQFVELVDNDADFRITSDKPILVMQYMEGQNAGGGSGDPAMFQAVAIDQYRDNYLFHAPTNYEFSYANITAETGASVTLDGAAVTGWVPIGTTNYSVARVTLSNAGDGNHTIDSDQPVGVSVYGYGRYTSYWYAGGANVLVIN